jgi:PST family polysaccharide transporter
LGKAQKDSAASVTSRTRRGISWNLLGAVATNAIRVVVIAVLGRTLTSSDFGIVAAAISVNVILYAIRDLGVGQALIQRETIDHGHQATAFAVSTYLGVGLAALLFVAAPLIGRVYGIPASVDVIRALGLLFALRGISATSRMMCQRSMRFRAIAIIDALSFAVGSGVSIVSATLGAGPWALVAGYLVEELLSTSMYLLVSRPVVSLAVDRSRLRDLMSFGVGQTISQIAGIVATYGDTFVIGNVLGARSLGFYTRAYELIKMPSMVFSTVVGSVLFPTFSRLQKDRAALADGFRRALFVNALVLLPASALLIVLAPEAIELLMGRGWDSAVGPFRILAASMLFRTTQKLGGLVGSAAGAVNAIAAAYVLYMVQVIGGAALTIRWGIVGVAVSTSIAIVTVGVTCSWVSMQVSSLRWKDWFGAHAPGIVLAGISAAIAFPIAEQLRARDIVSAQVLVGSAIPAVVVVAIVALYWARQGTGDFAWVREEAVRVYRRKRGRGKGLQNPQSSAEPAAGGDA